MADIQRRDFLRKFLEPFNASKQTSKEASGNAEKILATIMTRRKAMIAGGIGSALVLSGIELGALATVSRKNGEILPAEGALKEFYELRDNPPLPREQILEKVKELAINFSNKALPSSVAQVYIGVSQYDNLDEEVPVGMDRFPHTKRSSVRIYPEGTDLEGTDYKNIDTLIASVDPNKLDSLSIFIADSRQIEVSREEILNADSFLGRGETSVQHETALQFVFPNLNDPSKNSSNLEIVSSEILSIYSSIQNNVWLSTNRTFDDNRELSRKTRVQFELNVDYPAGSSYKIKEGVLSLFQYFSDKVNVHT